MIDVESILKAITIVLRNDGAEKTVLSSLQSAAVTAVTTFLGAIVMGPIGIIAGATAGSIGTYMVKKNAFKPLLQVIEEDLSTAQKRELTQHVRRAIAKFEITDVLMLMTLARNDVIFREAVSRTVTDFLDSTHRLQRP